MGSAFDPETGMLYVPSITATFAADLVPGEPDTGLRYVRGTREHIAGPQGLPIMKPPYGRITAIDLNTGRHVWMVPNADGPRDHPALKGLNLPPLGQPMHDRVIVTPTLLFAAQGDIIGSPVVAPGVIRYPLRELGLCAGITDAKYKTTTEVYPDSPRATPQQCNDAQVAAVRAALDYGLAHG